MPSRTFAIASADGSSPKPWAPLAPANTSVSPLAPFSRSCSACALAARGIRMIDPLHDLPGRGRGPAGDRRGTARAPIDRIDLQAIIGLADQFLERRALQHAVDQLAPVVVGRRRKIRRQPQVVGHGVIRPGRSLVVRLSWAEIATWRPPSQTVVLGLFRLGQSQVGQPLNTIGRKLRQRCRDAASRNDTVGRDLRQRHQHEGALEQPGMRQRQFRLVIETSS